MRTKHTRDSEGVLWSGSWATGGDVLRGGGGSDLTGELVSIRGLIVSVETNGDLRLDGEDTRTLSLGESGIHCTVTVTSVSTEGGRVAVQVRV